MAGVRIGRLIGLTAGVLITIAVCLIAVIMWPKHQEHTLVVSNATNEILDSVIVRVDSAVVLAARMNPGEIVVARWTLRKEAEYAVYYRLHSGGEYDARDGYLIPERTVPRDSLKILGDSLEFRGMFTGTDGVVKASIPLVTPAVRRDSGPTLHP